MLHERSAGDELGALAWREATGMRGPALLAVAVPAAVAVGELLGEREEMSCAVRKVGCDLLFEG